MQYIPIASPRFTADNVNLEDGEGFSILLWKGQGDKEGLELAIGATHHDIENATGTADIWHFRLGVWREMLRKGPVFARGAIGFNLEIVRSDDFPDFVSIVIPDIPFPWDLYSRIDLGIQMPGFAIMGFIAGTAGWLENSREDREWATMTSWSVGVSMGFPF